MKILHIISGLKIGGAESALLNFLSKVTKTSDKHVVVYFHYGINVEKIKALGLDVYKISGLLYLYDPICFFRLRKLIKKLKPDLIHTACWSANFMGRLVGRTLKVPVICDIHGNSYDEGKFRNFFDLATVYIPAKLIAVSEQTKKNYMDNIVSRIHDPSKRAQIRNNVVVINNGIDADRVIGSAGHKPLLRQDFGFNPKDFVIGAVGRLEAVKSYDVLIKAFAMFLKNSGNPESLIKAKLCVVGDGAERQNLRNLVAELDMEKHVVFVGQRDDAVRFYPLFDCFALSSQSEGMSIALLEALVFGLPIVTTHNSMEHDVIRDGVNGFLVPSNNVFAFSQALKKIYSDENLALKIRFENKKLVLNSFSLNATVEQYKKIYTEIFCGTKKQSNNKISDRHLI
jgi:glycosyltransferase involved in cell wall biosynthesis